MPRSWRLLGFALLLLEVDALELVLLAVDVALLHLDVRVDLAVRSLARHGDTLATLIAGFPPTLSLARIVAWIAASVSTLRANALLGAGTATIAGNLAILSSSANLTRLLCLIALLVLHFLLVLLLPLVANCGRFAGLTISLISFLGMRISKLRKTSWAN